MPVEFNWEVENQVYNIYFSGIVNEHDLRHAYDHAQKIAITAGDNLVHALIHIDRIHYLSTPFGRLKEIFVKPDAVRNNGYGIIVSAKNTAGVRVMRFMASTIFQMLGLRFRVVNCHEQALKFVTSIDGEILFEKTA